MCADFNSKSRGTNYANKNHIQILYSLGPRNFYRAKTYLFCFFGNVIISATQNDDRCFCFGSLNFLRTKNGNFERTILRYKKSHLLQKIDLVDFSTLSNRRISKKKKKIYYISKRIYGLIQNLPSKEFLIEIMFQVQYFLQQRNPPLSYILTVVINLLRINKFHRCTNRLRFHSFTYTMKILDGLGYTQSESSSKYFSFNPAHGVICVLVIHKWTKKS